jgi:hypothetical protein
VKYGSVEYPFWAHCIGFIMSAASMLWIPGYAIYYLMTQRGSFRDVRNSFIVYIEILDFYVLLLFFFQKRDLLAVENCHLGIIKITRVEHPTTSQF